MCSVVSLCNPMDCSSPGSSVHGIFQVRILEWVAISFSRGSFQLRDESIAYISCIGRWIIYRLCHVLQSVDKNNFSFKLKQEEKCAIVHSSSDSKDNCVPDDECVSLYMTKALWLPPGRRESSFYPGH